MPRPKKPKGRPVKTIFNLSRDTKKAALGERDPGLKFPTTLYHSPAFPLWYTRPAEVT